MIKHVVLMKFHPEVTDGDIEKLENGLAVIPDLMAGVNLYEFGRDLVRTEESYDFALVSAFDDLEALESYRNNPDNMAVIHLVRKLSENIAVVDFECE